MPSKEHRPCAKPACLTLVVLALVVSASGHILARPRSSAPALLLDRPGDPVVLTGPRLSLLSGLPPANLVAYRYSGGWQAIPVQVDERDTVDFGRVYNSTPVDVTELVYTDSNTWTGPDTNPLVDVDDEVVFMARDAGSRILPGSASEPVGVVAGSGVEVTVTDPLVPSAVGYVYLFRSVAVAPPPGSYVSYSFVLLSGDYKSTYNLVDGPNPEDSRVTTSYYQHHFSDRWIDDELRIGNSPSAPDLLDRHKILFDPEDCRRSEETFCGINLPGGADSRGAFVVNKSGPVRAIRSYLGANSGVITQRDHFFYERRHDVVTILRVHPIPSIIDFFDYAPAASGMTYTLKTRTGQLRTATIDGQPDSFLPGNIEWEMISGAAGTIVMSTEVATDIVGLGFTSYYYDDSTPATVQCTGDQAATGSSGLFVTPGAFEKIPCTDPLRVGLQDSCPSFSQLSWTRSISYERPGIPVSTADAQTRRDGATTLLTASAMAWTVAPPQPAGDSVGVYVSSSGAWFLRNANAPGTADVAFAYGPAGAGLVELKGDWDGDGDDTPGLYDPMSGAFFLKNSNAGGSADLTFVFGVGGPTLIPITGDWDGNGTDTIGLFDTTSGAFFLKNLNAPGEADIVFTFGSGGAVVPLVGDWNDDGADTIGIYVPSSGAFFLRNANSSGPADVTVSYGTTGVVPVIGDWNDDGVDTIGIYVPSSGAWFLRNSNAPGIADLVFTFGPPGVRPFSGNWDGQ